MTNGAVQGLAERVAAVRAELSEAQRDAANGVRWAPAAVQALKKDLAVLESRLAEATAPRCKHDFADGDVCSKCDAARPMRRTA